MERDQKNIYTYYKEYHPDLVECVYNVATSKQARSIFIKKWGPHLSGLIISNMTQEDNDLFLKYASIFEKYLKYSQKLLNKGYSLTQIKNILIEKLAVQKVSSKNKKVVKIYNNVNSILEQYNITKDEMLEVLDTLSSEKRCCFIYLYGINRPQMKLDKVEEVLKISHVLALAYIQAVYDALEKYQVTRDTQSALPHIDQKQPNYVKRNLGTKTRKQSIYDYFEAEDKNYVIEKIEYWKQYNENNYNLIVKLYGSTYDHLDKAVKLTDEESKIWNNILTQIKKYVVNRKQGLISSKGRLKNQSIYDYFEVEAKIYVIEKIEYWKQHNEKYYNLIVKLYGSTYDHLDKAVKLTEEESKIWSIILTQLKKYVVNRKQGLISSKGRLKNQSIYDYFEVEAKIYVIEKIEYWKQHNEKYYNLIVKLYGSTYDHLDKAVKLTDEESQTWHNLISQIKKYIVNRKQGLISSKGRLKNQSIYDYFEAEAKNYVIEKIEYWKQHNEKYYNLIVKLYGPTYDHLDKTIKLTDEESQIWNTILTQFRKYIVNRKHGLSSKGKARNQSIYDYFKIEEKNDVIERIEYWRKHNENYYNLIVKLYGPTYDHLDKAVKLTDEESKIWNNILTQLKKYIDNRKNQCNEIITHQNDSIKALQLKDSIYDYVNEKKVPYLLEQIEYWKQHNENYYNLIVKLYGPTYDHLDSTYEMTEEESKLWKTLQEIYLFI